MNKELIIIGAMTLMLAMTVTASNVNAQNVTTNASNAVGNMSASANQTASELGQNASEAAGQAMNQTGEALQDIGEGAAGVVGNITEGVQDAVNGSE